MKALVCPNTTFEMDGATMFRVAEVSETGFDVAEPLFWVDCPEDCVADLWYFNTTSNACLPKPEPEPEEPQEQPPEQPVTPVEVMP
jgi:hypothetical protein